MILKDLYGKGIWQIILPLGALKLAKSHGSNWRWDPYEKDGVNLADGSWLRPMANLTDPPRVHEEERTVYLTSVQADDVVMMMLDLTLGG